MAAPDPDGLRGLVEPDLIGQGLELVDVQVGPGLVRFLVDKIEGGIDLDTVAAVTEQISRALDEHDPMPSKYTLEVSSPGIERPLRTPAHFQRHVGQTVAVRTVAGTEGERRIEGRLTAADDDGITVVAADTDEARTIPYSAIERARTTFVWEAAPKPSTRPKKKPSKGRSNETKATA